MPLLDACAALAGCPEPIARYNWKVQRDWGLVAIGVGIVMLSASFAVLALLVYGDSSECD